jgi:hypothetical protein
MNGSSLAASPALASDPAECYQDSLGATPVRHRQMELNMRAPVLMCSLVILLATGITHAQDKVYRWKDADGVTHYSDEPPAQGSAEEFEVNVPPPASEPPAADPVDATATGEESPPDDAEAARAAQNQQACNVARANLATLEANLVVNMDIDGDGTVETLSVEQRDAQIASNRAAIEAYCAD